MTMWRCCTFLLKLARGLGLPWCAERVPDLDAVLGASRCLVEAMG
jgi:hypothetical protein